MKSWQPASLPAWLKDENVEVILISEFVVSEIRINSTKYVWSDPYFWIHEFRNKDHFSSGSRGAPGAQAPPGPQIWGPRLYSEAQITPFDT